MLEFKGQGPTLVQVCVDEGIHVDVGLQSPSFSFFLELCHIELDPPKESLCGYFEQLFACRMPFLLPSRLCQATGGN